MVKKYDSLAIKNVNDFMYAHAPNPVSFKNGMVIGGGTMYPEVNMTLPVMTEDICKANMPYVLAQYKEMITGICARSKELNADGFVIEIETLPPNTANPDWGTDVTKTVRDVMAEYEAKYGIKSVLRMTHIDIRDINKVDHMYKGQAWETLMKAFEGSAKVGAELLSVESTGGKEITDDALIMCDLPKFILGYAMVSCPDMFKLWSAIADVAKANGAKAAGDTACGFANTAMVLAEQNYIPRVFSAVTRVLSGVRSLVAVEAGAVGPDKDCGYEGPYLKAIAGIPISMEGRMACGAHLSHVGNIPLALCDIWSNESIQNIKLLSGMAPTAGYEQLYYDCKMMNLATKRGKDAALLMRDLLVESDSHDEPQGWIMRPDVVLEISAEIIKANTYYDRMKAAAAATIKSLKGAIASGQLKVNDREKAFLDVMDGQVANLPADLDGLKAQLIDDCENYDPKKYE